jgi:hypothetical protein
MVKKVIRAILVLLLVLAISTVAGWVAGPGAAGTAFMMIMIGIGVWVGADWGGNRATEVEEYRQELISKKGQRAPTPPDQSTETEEGQGGSTF